ncbi:hypothetical protein DTO271D3_1298 [Paecilomyces variotii]|nr:hypothetical protein DTO271D3_1298 [Paecilomyces variotii]
MTDSQLTRALSHPDDQERLKAVAELPFPANLKQLETYLGLTGWIRRYCPGYAAITELLESRKTLLLRTLSTGKDKNSRQHLAAGTPLALPSQAELRAYQEIQQYFANPSFLVYHSPKRQLYIDLDASGMGFSAVAYHLREDGLEDGRHMSKVAPEVKANANYRRIQPILFLNRRINAAERNLT